MIPAVAHQFDDAEQQRRAAGLGMWVFLSTEVLFFGVLFTAYTVSRVRYAAEFARESHRLYQSIGAANTAVLLISSLTMVLAVRAAHLGRRRAIVAWLGLTAALGTVFLVLKSVEYSLDLRENLLPLKGDLSSLTPGAAELHGRLFLTFYWVMTGLHALHVTAAVIMATALAMIAHRKAEAADAANAVEVGGLYWHFVDIVWIFLFPLLYLVT